MSETTAVTNSTTNEFETRPPEIVRIRVTLESVKDGILMSPRTREFLEEIAKLKQKSATDEGLTLEARAAKKIIKNDKGEIGLPLKYLTACLMEAGREVKNGTKRISTADKTSLFLFLDFPDSFFPFTDQKAEWLPDLQAGNGGQKGKQVAVAIIRPLFKKWSIVVEVDVDTNECSMSNVKKLFAIAGRSIGVGDHRAKSNFGRFKVAKWEEVKV